MLYIPLWLVATPPPSPATLGRLALLLPFPALSDLATVVDEGGRSGDGASGGGGTTNSGGSFGGGQQVETSCVEGLGDVEGFGSRGAGSGGAGSWVGCLCLVPPPLLPLVLRESLFVLPLPPPSSLLTVPDPVSDFARAASPIIPYCLATLVAALAISTAVASALVAQLAGFATTCRRAYLAGLVSASLCPPSVGGELALGCDVREDRQFDLEYLPYPLSIRTCYVALGRHHPAHWRAARRVLRYLVRLASRT
ncbi:unnamed protein product [Closterium sp. NIES-54]